MGIVDVYTGQEGMEKCFSLCTVYSRSQVVVYFCLDYGETDLFFCELSTYIPDMNQNSKTSNL